MSNETEFCCTYDHFKQCWGNETVACDPGNVIKIVEVEKGDDAFCDFLTCCNETSLNTNWTDFIREHCDGNRTCDTSLPGPQVERTVKTVFDCISDPQTNNVTNNSSSWISDIQSTTTFEETKHPSLELTTWSKSATEVFPSQTNKVTSTLSSRTSDIPSATTSNNETTIPSFEMTTWSKSTTEVTSSDGEASPVAVTVVIILVVAIIIFLIVALLVWIKRRNGTIPFLSIPEHRTTNQRERIRNVGGTGEDIAAVEADPKNAEEAADYVNIAKESGDAQYINLHVANEEHYEQLTQQPDHDTYSALN